VPLPGADAFAPLPPPPKGAEQDIVCYEPFQTAYINADGTITPCCWSSRILGRMTEASPEEIWLGDAAASLRAEILANDLDPICKRCVAMGRAAGRVDT
jgi:radical SAM protein with 4Fe4S-binding SPASM domain